MWDLWSSCCCSAPVLCRCFCRLRASQSLFGSFICVIIICFPHARYISYTCELMHAPLLTTDTDLDIFKGTKLLINYSV